MGLHTKGPGKVITNGVMVFKHGQMALNMLASGKGIFNVATECTLTQLVILTKASGMMANLTVKVN